MCSTVLTSDCKPCAD